MNEVTKVIIEVKDWEVIRELNPNQSKHRMDKHKWKKKQEQQILAYYHEIHWTLRPDEPWEKAHLKVTFMPDKESPGKGRDLDNLIASIKGAIDGLIGVLILDDSAKRLTQEHYYQVDRENGPKIIYEYTKVK